MNQWVSQLCIHMKSTLHLYNTIYINLYISLIWVKTQATNKNICPLRLKSRRSTAESSSALQATEHPENLRTIVGVSFKLIGSKEWTHIYHCGTNITCWHSAAIAVWTSYLGLSSPSEQTLHHDHDRVAAGAGLSMVSTQDLCNFTWWGRPRALS